MTEFLHDVITGRNKGLGAGLLKPVLGIFSFIYILIIKLIRLLIKIGLFKITTLERPVVSIGNLTAGGTGKTPFAVYICQKIQALGNKPVILMRGYMSGALKDSDEAQMLRRHLPGVPVYARPDRVASAQESARKDNPDIFILDDGFQHWKVKRDLDIVLLDALDPFSNGWLLPLGLLREPKSHLARADVIVISRADLATEKLPELYNELRRLNPHAPVLEAAHVPTAVEDPFSEGQGGAGGDWSLLQGRICACSAIGSPRGFECTLRKLGADVVHHEIFRDHHVYTARDVRDMVGICRQKKLDRVVTTQKDVVKLLPFKELWEDIRLLALGISVRIIKGEYEISSRINSLLHS